RPLGLVERPCGPLRVGPVRTLLDSPAGFAGMQGAGRLASKRFLDYNGLDARQIGRRLLDRGAVAGDQRSPDTNGARQRRVEGGLALLAAIDSNRIDGAAAVRVVHDGALAAGRGVVADEERDLAGGSEAGHN